jgi:rhodanese-related sulfurtransferase
MRKIVVVALACLMVAVLANAQMKVKPAPKTGSSPFAVTGARTNNEAQFPRISQADALKLYKEGKAVFVDVRSNEQFSQGHIKGALSIPGSQVVGRFKEVPAGKTVIAYCACTAEQSSGRAALQLIGHGVKNVFALKGGWAEWESAGNPTATGAK